MSRRRRHRRQIAVRGAPAETRQRAAELVEPLADGEVLWVGGSDPPRGVETADLTEVRHRLGGSYDAVVLDLHASFDADVIGQCHGLIRGGGGLVWRLPPDGAKPTDLHEGLAAHPYGPDDVGSRLWERLEAKLFDAASESTEPLTPTPGEFGGTDEQAALVERLTDLWRTSDATRSVVVADRGRGKSSALGLALRQLRDRTPILRVAVTARHPGATAEVFRFCLDADEIPDTGPVRYVPVGDLLADGTEADLIVVDEAAQFSVPVLRRLVDSAPDADLAFATTTHGYEGTGRGFELRFVDWLRERPPPVSRFTLEEPIRWEADDPLEAHVFDALLLDAEPATTDRPLDSSHLEHRHLDRDRLAADETLLRQVFGLLVEAHYRTTPADLHRMLDAPNLHLHALLLDGDAVAATWAAEEGDLPPKLADEVYAGRRIRGHALPEILLANLSRPATGDLEIVRSVRTATHPDYRRRGLATRLIEHVHASYRPDLFGTIFGATPGVVRLRRRLGHRVVRLSPSHGRRAGEPSVAMLRPASAAGRTLVASLREEFARKLPIQLELMRADGDLDPGDQLVRELRTDLPPVSGSLDPARMREVVDHYAHGPPTYESAAFAVEPFVERHAGRLPELDETHRQLLEARVRERASWRETAGRAPVETVRAAMRGLRRAVRALLERVDAR